MAFEPYLSERNIGCYKAPMCPPHCPKPFDPNCTVDPYTQLFRDRWNLIRTDPCQRTPSAELKQPCPTLNSPEKTPEQICVPPIYEKWQTTHQKHFKYPKSHNAVDDCCRSPCPCVDKFPELPGNISYRCTMPPPPCPPLDNCTTYRYFHGPKCMEQPWRYQYPCWNPCDCPMETGTITHTDYIEKQPIPNGPACSEIIMRPGLWSTEQFCKEFTDETTTGVEYKQKCAQKPLPYCPFQNLCIPNCPSRCDTTTRVDYPPKETEDVCYPDWISNDLYYKPETNVERCTTYKHYYQPYPLPYSPCTLDVRSAKAIPFCTLNKLCYSCHDPEPNQQTPVELKDADPWPYVVRCPIRYQDNLQTDPCAAMSDETVTRCDYPAKRLCRPTESFAPIPGHIDPLIRFNDDTTNRVSYPAYTRDEYKYAFGNAGNPCGIYWGPFRCPPNNDPCLPRFPTPHGHPLKPFVDKCCCPCGPFDNRSTYTQDFRFRNAALLKEMEEDMCRQPNVPKGSTIYRHDFVPQGGKKAEVTPPPPSKGHRCLHPCSLRSTDTLYRINYHDFWKSMDRSALELYRAKPTIVTRRKKEVIEEEPEEIIYKPIFLKRVKPKPEPYLGPFPEPTVDFQTPEYQRCRDIPYSGQNILNRSYCTEKVCDGYR